MNNLITGLITSQDSATIGAIMLIFFIMFLVLIGLYVYTSLALMNIAKRTKTEPAWLAWIPIGNLVLLSRIATMHWWPILLYIPAIISLIIGVLLNYVSPIAGSIFTTIYYLIIGVFVVFSTIWTWKMYEKVRRPGWWALLPVCIGLFGTIFLLINSTTTLIIGLTISLISGVLSCIYMGIAAWGKMVPMPIRRKNHPKH